MFNKIKHPKIKDKNNLIKESINIHLQKRLGFKAVLETTSSNSLRISFNKSLGEAVNNDKDFIKNELKSLLYTEYGLLPIISKHKNSYNIVLNPEDIYLENLQEDIRSNVDPNIVLDSRFIWLFSLLDKNQNVLVEDIDSLDDAIELAIKNNDVKMIVASPFIDPDPKNSEVELVFADNPGPIVIYDGTEPKDFEESEDTLDEGTLEETTQVDSINKKVSYGLSQKEQDILKNKLFKDWWLARDKDNDLYLFKSKPVRGTLNLENSGDNVRWLPELNTSYDYRDFNKYKNKFKFLTWESEPIQVKKLLSEDTKEEPQQQTLKYLQNNLDNDNVFKAIELLINASSFGGLTNQISNEFKEIFNEIIYLGSEFIEKVSNGFLSILKEMQRKEEDERVNQLKQQLILAARQFNYLLSVSKTINSKEVSLKTIAKDAGVI